MNADFTDAKEGDVAYAASWLLSDRQTEAAYLLPVAIRSPSPATAVTGKYW